MIFNPFVWCACLWRQVRKKRSRVTWPVSLRIIIAYGPDLRLLSYDLVGDQPESLKWKDSTFALHLKVCRSRLGVQGFNQNEKLNGNHSHQNGFDWWAPLIGRCSLPRSLNKFTKRIRYWLQSWQKYQLSKSLLWPTVSSRNFPGFTEFVKAFTLITQGKNCLTVRLPLGLS